MCGGGLGVGVRTALCSAVRRDGGVLGSWFLGKERWTLVCLSSGQES